MSNPEDDFILKMIAAQIENEPLGITKALADKQEEKKTATDNDEISASAKARVEWAKNQFATNKNAWKGEFLGKQSKCNEFVAAAHGNKLPPVKRGVDREQIPEVHGVPVGKSSNEAYYLPTVEDLAYAGYAKDLLSTHSIKSKKPGDIIVWYGPNKYNGTAHHSALYLGDDKVMYQHHTDGLRIANIEEVSDALGFEESNKRKDPIVRRWKD